MLISFLFLNKNICCGYSLEAPRRGASNEYPQHMFSSINKKNIMWIPPLICSYGDKLEPLSYWVDVQADPSLSWSYRSIVGFVLHWIILKRSSLNYPHLPPELNSTLTQSIKSAMNPTILGFYPKSTLNYILWLNLNPIHSMGQTGWTVVILYADPLKMAWEVVGMKIKTRGPRATGRSPEWHCHYRYADVMQHFSNPVIATNEKIII